MLVLHLISTIENDEKNQIIACLLKIKLLICFVPGTFPIDTTKTRLQIQGQKIDKQFSKLKYSGMTDAFVQISKQEGVKALYSG